MTIVWAGEVDDDILSIRENFLTVAIVFDLPTNSFVGFRSSSFTI